MHMTYCKPKQGRKGGGGWQVRDGNNKLPGAGTHWFGNGKYGGNSEARAAAVQYVKAHGGFTLRGHGANRHLQRNNKTGVTGIQLRWVQHHSEDVYLYVVASTIKGGRAYCTRRSLQKHGLLVALQYAVRARGLRGEEAARALAILRRTANTMMRG